MLTRARLGLHMALGFGWCVAVTLIWVCAMHINQSSTLFLNASLLPVALFGGGTLVALTPAGVWRRLLVVTLFLPLAYATVFFFVFFVHIVLFHDPK